jgi:peroxiredoxin
MSSRPWVLAGLLCGVITGLAVLALVVAFGPEPSIARASSAPPAAVLPTGALATSPGGSTGSPNPPQPTGSGASSASLSPGTSTTMHIGRPAPVLVVPQVGGGTIDLATLRGRPVWVMFVVADCSACRSELTLMNGFVERYNGTGLVVIAIDVRDDEGAAANLARVAGVTFPMGLDLDGNAQRLWEAAALPAHYWIDREAVVRDAATGVLGAEAMARGLGKALPGVDVRP